MKRVMPMVGFLVISGLLVAAAVAQNQSSTSSQSQAASGSSLGDYARGLRKDGGQKAKPKVFDNDNLPKNDKLSIVGTKTSPLAAENKAEEQQEAKSTAAGTGPAGSDSRTESAAPGDDVKQKQALWKQWQDKISSEKGQIDLLQRELDVLQREYQIRAAAMYADAGNRLRNQGAWDKQDADYKQQIADKTKAVADAKDKLDDMSEEARKAGVPSSMLD